jgi:hypothetical protein
MLSSVYHSKSSTLLKRQRWCFHGVRLSIPVVKTTKQGLLILAGTSAAGQAPVPRQRVLVLYSDERLPPANIIMDEAIRAAFAVGTKTGVEFYSEFLDVARFPGRSSSGSLGKNIGSGHPTW